MKFPHDLQPPVRPLLPTIGDHDVPADADHDDEGGDEIATGKDVIADGAQEPRIPTNVTGPTAAEIDLHNATHLPYRSWCRWCVMSRKPTPKHVRAHHADRDVPLLVGDYAFVRSWDDSERLTIYLGRLYPTNELVIRPCDQQGSDDYAISRLSNVVKNML